MIRVGGLTYWQIKQKALNGGRSKLSADQLGFVGISATVAEMSTDSVPTWAPAGASPRLLEQQQAELAALLDTMPGWSDSLEKS